MVRGPVPILQAFLTMARSGGEFGAEGLIWYNSRRQNDVHAHHQTSQILIQCEKTQTGIIVFLVTIA